MRKFSSQTCISIFMAFCLACMPALSSHGEELTEMDVDVTGEWYLISVEANGREVPASAMGLEMTLSMREDGTLSLLEIEDGEEDDADTEAGTWELDGFEGTALIDDDRYELSVFGESLSLLEIDDDDTYYLNFGREKPAEVTISPVKEDPALEDFDGTWEAKSIELFGISTPCEEIGLSCTLTISGGEITCDMITVNEETGEEETLNCTLKGDLEDEVLSVLGGEEEDYIDFSLQLHEDGTMTDGYEDDPDEEDFYFGYFIYERIA